MDRSVMKIFLKKSLRDIKSNIRQFLSIIFIIGIAVTLFVGLQANYQSINNRVTKMYENGNMSDVYVTYNVYDEDTKDEDNIKLLFDYNLNIQTEKRLYYPATINGSDTYLCITNSYPTLNRACNLYVRDENNKTKYVETEKLNIGESGDFLIIDKRMASMLSNRNDGKIYDIGDEFTINIDLSPITSQIGDNADEFVDAILQMFPQLENYIPDKNIEQFKSDIHEFLNSASFNNAIIKAKVTNFMTHPENISSDNGTSPVTLMSFNEILAYLYGEVANFIEERFSDIDADPIREAYKDAGSISFYNQVLIRFNNQPWGFDLKNATDKIRTYLDKRESSTFGNYTFIMNLDNLISNLAIKNDISQAQTFAWVFPLVFIVVAVLIAITTISQLIIKEHNIIGTLKGLGISNSEIRGHYFLTSFSLGFVGCLLGCIIGPLLIPGILDIKYQMLYSVPAFTFEFPWIAAIATTAVVIGMILIITTLILKREFNITPAESMLPVTPKIKFKAHKKASKNMRFTSIKIALRNIRVYLVKSLMVVIGVMGCEALMICGFGIEDTVNFGIDHDITKYYGADIMLTYGYKSNEIDDKLLADENLNNIGKIESTYETFHATGSIQYGNSSYIDSAFVLVTNDAYQNHIIDMEFKQNTIAINTSTADDLGVKVGDKANVKINGKIISKEIGLIFEFFSIHSIYGYSDDPDFAQVANGASGLYVYTDISDNEEKLNEMMNYITENYSEISTANTSFSMRKTISTYVESVSSMTNTIKVFALLLAVVCLLNLALLSFKERTREIATLKVLGLNNREIGRSLIYESVILTAIGALIGISLGFPMLYAVLNTNQNSLVSFIYYISILTYVMSTIICIGTAFIVNVMLSTRIRKVPMVESLKSVE